MATSPNKVTKPKTHIASGTRALRACESCRRQKSRCYPSDDPTGVCVKCLAVGRECSFITDGPPPRQTVYVQVVPDPQDGLSNPAASLPAGDKRLRTDDTFNNNKRIKETNSNVKKILQFLTKGGLPLVDSSGSFNTRTTLSAKKINHDSAGVPSIEVSPSQTSPFQVIRSSVKPEDVPTAIGQILSQAADPPVEEEEPPNILSLGIIALNDCVSLVDKFRKNYGEWISLPDSVETNDLIHDFKFKCPVLLTSICLVSLRYNITRSRTKDEESLQRQLSIRLGQELKEFLTSPNEFKSVEFLETLVILSVFGLSLTNSEVNIDPWFLSGLGIQWFLTFDINTNYFDNKRNTDDNDQDEPNSTSKVGKEDLAVLRVWNHLCLVHLSNCVFSGRMCVLDEIRLNQTRKTLELTQGSNYDVRVNAEISLQLLLYNFIQSTTIKSPEDIDIQFETFEDDIKQWHDQWEHLFKQPEDQLLVFGFHYSYVVAMYHYKLGNRSLLNTEASDDEKIIQDFEILNKMLYHSLKLLNNILKLKNSSFFIRLSDQVHFCLFYVSVVFLKVIRWIDVVDKGTTYSKEELNNFIDKVTSVREIFTTISKAENDLAHKYSDSLHFGTEETREFINI